MIARDRFVTMVLGAGVVVLLAAILLGEHMGDRVMVEAADSGNLTQTPLITPVPQPTDRPYGPDWKNSQPLAAAGDPRFPDPRIPPKPLPTPERTPSPSPTPTWTPNPNVPIWDQTRLPSPSPSATTFSEESTDASGSPGPTPTPPPPPTNH
ncbi:MAG TPA: hypothetical protein VMG98_00025 [Verrucomicrobiae bacterium]|nr:hypothetical protein [Verrucomicrobiae bacterium]